MYKILKYYTLRPLFIWLFIFAIFKSIFLIFHWNSLEQESLSHILKVFSKSLKIDVSSTSYILAIPFLLAIIQYFYHSKIIKKISKYYHLMVLGIVSTINVIDIQLFTFWSSKISLKSFLFLNTPDQIIKSMGYSKFLMALLFVVFHFIIGKALLEKYYFKKSINFKKSFPSFIFFTLLSAGFLILGIRGGFQVVPINQSDTYFSTNNTLNVAGVNPLWNIANTFVQNKAHATTNPYIQLEKKEAKKIVSNLYEIKKDTTIKLFNIEKPNIIYIALEGVNANVLKYFNKEKSYAPEIESLLDEGYFFSNMYASGSRSDQGMISLLSGFPPTPVNSICAQPEKFIHLPSFPKKLQENNYNCSYYFGGEAAFGNFKSYLIHSGFNPLIEVFDFPKKDRTQYLGVPDEFVFDKFSKDMNNAKEPFYSMIFTQTTHEPFDMPFNENIKDEKTKYLNTVKYVDSVIGDWYRDIKNKDWYDNTIFIISSDHSNYLPENYQTWVKERYHIPFLILGKPLKKAFRGKTNEGIFSQVDVPKSLLNQMTIESKEFKWSKDFMNPYSNQFAYFAYVEGYSFKTENNICGYGYNWKQYVGECDSALFKKQGQAFLQVLYDDFLSY